MSSRRCRGLRAELFLVLCAAVLAARGADQPAADRIARRTVLVLGSGGLVGRALVQWLEEREYEVLHVRNRRHIDLRVPGAMDVFNNSGVSPNVWVNCNIQAPVPDCKIKLKFQPPVPWLTMQRLLT